MGDSLDGGDVGLKCEAAAPKGAKTAGCDIAP
jgi:hypothetical protein